MYLECTGEWLNPRDFYTRISGDGDNRHFFRNPFKEQNDNYGRHVKRIEKLVEEKSSLSLTKRIAYGLASSEHTPEGDRCVRTLLYDRTLPEIYDLMEYIETRSAYVQAHEKDQEEKNPNK